MNPYYKWGLFVSIAGFLLQLIWIVYFFGFFRGMFQEFKENTTAALKRLEGVFFTDVKVVPHPSPEQAFVAQPPSAVHQSQHVQRSKR